MAIKSGLGQQFYTAGYDISGDVGAVDEMSVTIADLVVAGIDKSAAVRVQTRADARCAYSGFFNKAAGQQHAALKGMPTADVLESFLIAGAVRGAVAMQLLATRLQPYVHTHGRDGSAEFSVAGMANNAPLEDSVLLTAGTDSHGSASSSASVDENGAGGGDSAEGAIGFLQVMSFASGTPTFILEDSSNDSAWATLISFGAVAARTGVRTTVTGAVGRDFRATTTGTFTTAVFMLAVRRGLTVDRVDLS